ncbi:MAG: endonuclease/exonuclease/phosphatase family protein [Saprospiraceae bacterium]
MKIVKNISKFVGVVVGLFLLYVVIVILHGTATDYQPEEKITSEIIGKANQTVITDSTISLITWNIGFGGLGEESIFFYDAGGTLTSDVPVITPKEHFEKNQAAIEEFVKINKSDFYLIQEVDIEAKRSYGVNQFEEIQEELSNFSGAYAMNYNVKRVPLPVMEFWHTMGKVEAGLATFSKYQPKEATRYQFPGNYGWPTRIFQLDRCFLAKRFDVQNGKELVVINTHNSAYDKGGKLKAQQMVYLKNYLLSEYEKGNYVIVGGDWNQCPPNFKFDTFLPGKGEGYETTSIPMDYLPQDWLWVYDTTTPTNRKLTEVYKDGETFTTLIDFFLVSPNLQLEKVRNINQQFKYSDHQPVYVELKLK